VRGRQPRKNIVPVDQLCQFLVRHLFDFTSERDFLGLKADFGADLARDKIVVAGEHFHCNAGPVQNGNGPASRFFWRVKECEITGQH
jgi:hypothetical protein